MSPFKVIRCRYYADDGQAIPPYCSAGRRCTFLHPGDKGWPGGEPLSDMNKRQPDERDRLSEWPRLRASKPPDSGRSIPQSKASMSRSGESPTMMDPISEVSNGPSTHRGGLHTSKDQSPVRSIVKTFHDIAKFQAKITQDREMLDKTIDKLTAFRELSESLSKVSTASAAAVNPTLDAIIKTRYELEKRLDEDTRQLSDLWDAVFNVFLRAICRQFDNELEAGTDFLHQEARALVKSFPKISGSLLNSTSGAPDDASVSLRTSNSLVMSRSDDHMISRQTSSNTKSASKEEDPGSSINTPVRRSSDDGWGRKRRRVFSVGTEDSTRFADGATHPNLRDVIARMQQQLDEQADKIGWLSEQNQSLKQSNHQSHTEQTMVEHDIHSSPLSIPKVSHDLPSDVRQILQTDILAFISPALENQKQINEHWEMRLNAFAEELRQVKLIHTGNGMVETAAMDV